MSLLKLMRMTRRNAAFKSNVVADNFQFLLNGDNAPPASYSIKRNIFDNAKWTPGQIRLSHQ
jgi:hypothetical protein